jgi:hypothetical protein
MYVFATAPFWISLCMTKICSSFLSMRDFVNFAMYAVP